MDAPVLEVDDIDVAFSDRKVLDGVSFEIRRGEFTGLIGSNGVGKTTLLRVILGLQRPDSGEVRVLGEPLSGARGYLGYVPQKVLLDPDIPIRARDSWPLAWTRSATASVAAPRGNASSSKDDPRRRCRWLR